MWALQSLNSVKRRTLTWTLPSDKYSLFEPSDSISWGWDTDCARIDWSFFSNFLSSRYCQPANENEHWPKNTLKIREKKGSWGLQRRIVPVNMSAKRKLRWRNAVNTIHLSQSKSSLGTVCSEKSAVNFLMWNVQLWDRHGHKNNLKPLWGHFSGLWVRLKIDTNVSTWTTKEKPDCQGQ